jgi:hypothetical protein
MTYLYKLIIVMVNNPATNPISAKVMVDMVIAGPPQGKKGGFGIAFLCSLLVFTSSTRQ